MDEDDPVVTLRRCCAKQYPHWSMKASSALRVCVGPPSSYAGAKGVRGGSLVHLAAVGHRPPAPPPSFSPAFVHQLFPGEILFGYRGPGVALRVWVREPELSVCVTGEAPGGALEGVVPVRLPLEREAASGGASSGAGKSMCLRPGKDDILELMGAALPPGFPAASFSTAVGPGACSPMAPPLALQFFPPAPAPATWTPPGRCIHTYTRGGGGSSGAGASTFSVHRWAPSASTDLQAYLARMSTLAMWLIETASAIDVTDPRWEVLSVYQTGGQQHLEGGGEEEEEEEEDKAEAAPPPPALVGYATIYRFTNPMRDHRPHTLRLAQLLCLPRFQRAGHGQELLACVHRVAEEGAGEGDGVREVTVEDPCEGMARLRDAFDTQRAAALGLFAAHPAFAPQAPPEAMVDLGEEEAARAVAALRVTPLQARRCYLALLLGHLGLLEDPQRAASEEPRAKAYRLLVKRVLYNADADIRALKDAGVRKAALERGFIMAVAYFAGALAHCTPALASREQAAAAQQKWAEVARDWELELEASQHAESVERRLEREE
jgi:hypothetical protein